MAQAIENAPLETTERTKKPVLFIILLLLGLTLAGMIGVWLTQTQVVETRVECFVVDYNPQELVLNCRGTEKHATGRVVTTYIRRLIKNLPHAPVYCDLLRNGDYQGCRMKKEDRVKE